MFILLLRCRQLSATRYFIDAIASDAAYFLSFMRQRRRRYFAAPLLILPCRYACQMRDAIIYATPFHRHSRLREMP